MKRLAGMAVLAVLLAAPAEAQFNGGNVLGDNGVGAGTLPPPGWNVGTLYYRYDTDTVVDKDGNRIVFDASQPGGMTMHAVAPTLLFVSRRAARGGSLAVMLAPSFANGTMGAPVFGLQQDVDAGVGDMYVAPLIVGWHSPHADVKTGFGFFAPTGRYAPDATDNLGKGMWCWELSAGTTVFLDAARSWSVATAAFWEAHSNKRVQVTVGPRSGLTDVKVGQILSLEGGAGKSFLKGAASVGLAYYAQWKLTGDRFADPLLWPSGSPLGRHRVYGVGPDVTLPVAFKKHLISLVNVRCLWESGARTKSQGTSLLITAVFPVPSPKTP